MLVTFVPATLEVITAKSAKVGVSPVITLRSIDPITVNGETADTVNDGRFSVRLSPGASDWFRGRLAAATADPTADGSVAFLTAIREGSVTLPDFKQGKRAAHGESILSILPAMAADESDDDAATTDGETAPEPETATEPTPKANGRQKRS